MRMIASSCRTVMGMEDLALLLRSDCATRLRMETKWLDSFSDAATERRGAHRLGVKELVCNLHIDLEAAKMSWLELTICRI